VLVEMESPAVEVAHILEHREVLLAVTAVQVLLAAVEDALDK
jgi:hypothetical protein